MQISLQIKKPWARWFHFDRSFVYSPILYDLKPLRKEFTSISHDTGGSRGGARGARVSPLFLDQIEARRAEKLIL